mmetsp:Transcript_37236/g.111474  ORF Transcript_37236/g.111474 Transcript_37236/m.111474 type:complete len:238 (+) Transcript_37236:261-974(+)
MLLVCQHLLCNFAVLFFTLFRCMKFFYIEVTVSSIKNTAAILMVQNGITPASLSFNDYAFRVLGARPAPKCNVNFNVFDCLQSRCARIVVIFCLDTHDTTTFGYFARYGFRRSSGHKSARFFQWIVCGDRPKDLIIQQPITPWQPFIHFGARYFDFVVLWFWFEKGILVYLIRGVRADKGRLFQRGRAKKAISLRVRRRWFNRATNGGWAGHFHRSKLWIVSPRARGDGGDALHGRR